MTEPVRYPDIHLLLYGESGSGKSTFWATLIDYYAKNFNEPSLMLQFDPWDKATPFTDLGTVVKNEDAFYKNLGLEVDDVMDKDGKLICRIEYYADPDPNDPTAIQNFERRMVGFEKECRSWASVGMDSMTYFQRASLLKWKKLNPLESNKQQTNISWYGGVAEDAGSAVMSRAAWWRTNVGVICHIDEAKDELADYGVVRSVALAGKLSKRAPAGFGEVYRMKVVVDKKKAGAYDRELQTQADPSWVANSLVAKAPNPCKPTYEALWENWRKQ